MMESGKKRTLPFIRSADTLESCQCLTMHIVSEKLLRIRWAGYCGSLSGTAAVTAFLVPFRGHINSTTVALAFLLAVLFAAILSGSNPALIASILGLLSF